MKIYFRILISILILFLFQNCFEQKPSQKESNLPQSASNTTDKYYFLPKSTNGNIVHHKYYSLSYVEEHEQAEWVAYELKQSQLSYTNHRRPYFIDDPKVTTESASWRNYIRSGYDRGHLCPAGDRRFSKEAFDETFYTSNISPQKNDFNAGIWNNLEQKTRYWARKYDGVYVVTGGVLSKHLTAIGKEYVSVPEYFYKILLDNSRGEYKTIAFLLPHEESDEPLYKFVVSIDEIEKKTAIDFFANIPDNIENRLEKSSDYKGWSF